MTDHCRIPFNRPSLSSAEQRAVKEVLGSQSTLSGDGPIGQRCEAWLESLLGAKRVLLVTSGTHALDMAAILAEVQPGDEVIMPSFTFPSTANAFVLRGATPVFVDIRPDTLNIDEELVARSVSPRTKVIVVVHYAGVACEMDALVATAADHDLTLVEDNAHGLFGAFKGKPLGSFGALAAQSFHETKNLTCGEGGALVINEERLVERAEHVREKGTNRTEFRRGEVDKYTWVDCGSSYVLSDVLAALLHTQLARSDAIQDRRRTIWRQYYEALASWCGDNDVRMPHVPAHCDQAYHMFYLVTASANDRAGLLAHLASKGVLAVSHYVPLHSSPMAHRILDGVPRCPVTDSVSERLLRLPFYVDMTDSDQEFVIACIAAYRCPSRPKRRHAARSPTDDLV
jgi:dTDP-4-amino-4,6-dideoxygalactose transaminase